jgi:hypothetical protein
VTGVIAAITAMASSGYDLYGAYQHVYTGVRELMAAWTIYVAFVTSTRQKFKDIFKDPKAAESEIPPTPQVVAVAEQLKLNGSH